MVLDTREFARPRLPFEGRDPSHLALVRESLSTVAPESERQSRSRPPEHFSPNHPRCSLLPQQAKATRRACDSNRSVWTEEAPQSTPQLGRMGLAFTRLFARLFSKKEMRILMASPRIFHSCCRQLCRQDQRPAGRWQIPVAAVLPAGQFRSFRCKRKFKAITRSCLRFRHGSTTSGIADDVIRQ